MKYKVLIDNEEYIDADIRSANIERPLFDQLSIGNACEATLKIVFRKKTVIPTTAKMIPYALVNNQWEQLGVFYLDERSIKPTGIMTVVAYDSMLKADKVWVPDQSLEFPMPMDDAVDIIAELMGITVDPRTNVSHAYTIDYPANDYTLRDVLKFIAVANGGNWTITRNDQLLLVPLVGSMPPETHYLIEENGFAITFGGDRILV
jgi:hypothetical protein|nr:MAG TPA: hypothetical protein [Caudoviricetes sp.]